MKRPLRNALQSFFLSAIAAPVLGTAGIAAWVQIQTIARISQCPPSYTQAQCSQTSSWDSRSLANLTIATWQAWVGVGIVLGALNGAHTYWVTRRMEDQDLPLGLKQRLLAAMSRGYDPLPSIEAYDPLYGTTKE